MVNMMADGPIKISKAFENTKKDEKVTCKMMGLGPPGSLKKSGTKSVTLLQMARNLSIC